MRATRGGWSLEDRYARFAAAYDVLSGEPVYRAGRRAGIAGLRLRPGARVLDVGCGTGLDFAGLAAAVGPQGRVVGVDLSEAMLARAGEKARRHGWANVDVVRADAQTLDAAVLADAGVAVGDGFDAALFTYALSLMPDWRAASRAATGLLRPGGRVSVVDMQRPQGAAAWLSPLARAACAVGGADIEAHPWTLLEREADDVDACSLRGGHVQVRSGTVRSGSGRPASGEGCRR